jgi:hypothetical protein
LDTERHIDFLTITFPNTLNETVLSDMVGEFKESGGGTRWYKMRKVSATGVTLLCGGEEAPGKSLTLSGAPLLDLRERYGSDEAILAFVRDEHGRASRADFALNIYSTGMTPTQLWKEYEAGMVVTRSKSDRRITDTKFTNDGFYVGSPTSDKFMRVYNKGWEQKRFTDDWLRLELVTRKLVARAYVESIISGVPEPQFINRALVEFAAWPANSIFREATFDDNVEIPHFTRKPPKFWRCMESQVIPAMLRRAADNPQENTFAQFVRLFNEASRMP